MKKPKDRAMGKQLLVADLLSAFSSNSCKLDVSALSGSSSSLRRQADFIYSFLRSLPFPVIFSAIMHGTKGKPLTCEVLSAALDSSYSSVLDRDKLVIMQMILSCIQLLAFASLECLIDKKKCLDIYFTYLKRLLVIPKNLNHGEEYAKEILLCKDMVATSLKHHAIAEFFMCPIAMEVRAPKHRKSAPLLDEYIVDLKMHGNVHCITSKRPK